MTDPLHEIAAQARRLADHYRSMAEKPPEVERTAQALCAEAAADFDRIVRACERASSGTMPEQARAAGRNGIESDQMDDEDAARYRWPP